MRHIIKSWLILISLGIINSVYAAQSSDYMKPQIQGIVLMGSTAFNRASKISGIFPDNVADYKAINPEAVDGVVINLTWDKLEPQQNVYNFNEIENALAYIRQHNELYPNKQWHAKLRVWEGFHLPAWYAADKNNVYLVRKSVHGDPYFEVVMAKFWDKHYSEQIARLQEHLAMKYDNEPLINEVSISSCSSLTDEPFISPQDEFSLQSALKVGYTNQAYAECLLNAPYEYKYWKHTWLGYPLNPFRSVSVDGTKINRDVKITAQVIDKFATFSNAHFDNHDLNGEMTTKLYPMQIESAIAKHYPAVHNQFQLYWMTDDVVASIPVALALHADEVEVWWDTIHLYSLQQLHEWSTKLKNNK